MDAIALWPAGFPPGPDLQGWEGQPLESRATFDPETGPPLMRARTTADAWVFRARFPAIDAAERAAFLAFWEQIGRGAAPFLWRDPDGGEVRRWQAAAGDALTITRISPTRWSLTLDVIRLPSSPFWAALLPRSRLALPLAAYDLRRGIYDLGSGPVARPAAFSFGRASSGSRFDAAGLMVQAGSGEPRLDRWPDTGARRGMLVETRATNLLSRSQDFAAWTQTGTVTVAATAAEGLDGSLSAAALGNSGSATALISRQVTGLAASSADDYIASAFVKRLDANMEVTLNVYHIGDTETNVTFNLATGAITGAPWPGDARIEPIRDGWFRVSYRIARDATAASTSISFRIWPSGRGKTAGGMLVWGAQLERLPNLSWAAEDFTSGWATVGVTPTTGQPAPDGTSTAVKLVESAGGTWKSYYATGHRQFRAGVLYRASALVKRAAGSRNLAIQLDPDAFGATISGLFDLTAGSYNISGSGTDVTAAITALAGGWFACSLTARATADADSISPVYRIADGTNQNYAGDGSSGLYLWDARLEDAGTPPRPSSYIATTTSAVTRERDAAALVAAHGYCDVRVLFDDGSAQELVRTTLAAGWWPRMDRPHLAGLAIFAAGTLE